MDKTADAVIIGGGIFGVSAGFFLARKGFGNIVLLEPRSLAAVSTGHSAAAIRTLYSNPLTVQLAKRSVEMFRNSKEVFGCDTLFTPSGYLVLMGDESVEAGKRVTQLEREQGIRIEELDSIALKARYPMLQLDDIQCGMLEVDSGFADPLKTTQVMAETAKPWGLKVIEGVGATGIEVDGNGGVSSVTTSNGSVSTRVVVNAAGGWGRIVAGWVGLNYSFRWRRESDIVMEVPFDNHDMPWISDPELRFYCRPDGSGNLLAGLGFPKEIDPLDIDDYDKNIDAPTRDRIQGLVNRRFPGTANSRIIRGWSSMYTISDDWHPLVGQEPEVPGYYACVAGCGHGFKLAPPMGEALADIIAGETPNIDIHPLRPDRFIEGEYFQSVWGSGNRG